MDNPDVFKILKDLELKATGLDQKTLRQQSGYFVAFRDVGLPIRKEDFDDPYNPNRRADIEFPAEAVDPGAEGEGQTASGSLSPEEIYSDKVLTEIGRQMRAYVNTFLLTDSKLQMSPRYTVMNGSTKVSDTWWAILQGANGLPAKLELSDDLQDAYDRAQRVLMDEEDFPTRRYEKYMELSDEYDEAQGEYAREFADAYTDPQRLATWPQQGVYFRKKIDKAWKRWNSLGHKTRIEEALNSLAAQGQDPAVALISRAKQKFEENLFDFPGVGLLPLTLMIPSGWADERDQRGWNTYSRDSFRSQTSYKSSSTSYGGGGGFNLGFWSAGASLDRTTSKRDFGIQTNDLRISFDYSVVDIYRPWMGAELLNLGNWFLYGDYPAGTISDGTMSQEVPEPGTGFEPGFLPSIVTSLILIKDLHIWWSNWQSEWSSKSSSLSTSASIGYGPFAVRGNYGSKNHTFEAESNRESEGLTAPGIQLVGYVNQILPDSPRLNGADYMQELSTDDEQNEDGGE